ncbi:hypothetical protein HYH03_015841 [Edaphochlamys debaryana]|uniref:Uncharacterized protein n=1 Tax=Edaphochlamys debaryana TaxID=47281 RepID=A0A835XT18_9CHLO|nr:hypothetical protein HYH03_015841 [Edaphochlamys debaryana]|eukprot:KAG2485464.1 hypothetical protein HYH03_015841 [Edaphochlamys debaryana]
MPPAASVEQSQEDPPSSPRYSPVEQQSQAARVQAVPGPRPVKRTGAAAAASGGPETQRKKARHSRSGEGTDPPSESAGSCHDAPRAAALARGPLARGLPPLRQVKQEATPEPAGPPRRLPAQSPASGPGNSAPPSHDRTAGGGQVDSDKAASSQGTTCSDPDGSDASDGSGSGDGEPQRSAGTGGEGTGGEASGGETSGGEASGGEISGGEPSGGEPSGGEPSGSKTSGAEGSGEEGPGAAAGGAAGVVPDMVDVFTAAATGCFNAGINGMSAADVANLVSSVMLAPAADPTLDLVLSIFGVAPPGAPQAVAVGGPGPGPSQLPAAPLSSAALRQQAAAVEAAEQELARLRAALAASKKEAEAARAAEARERAAQEEAGVAVATARAARRGEAEERAAREAAEAEWDEAKAELVEVKAELAEATSSGDRERAAREKAEEEAAEARSSGDRERAAREAAEAELAEVKSSRDREREAKEKAEAELARIFAHLAQTPGMQLQRAE